jgi:hypothetical protein
MGQICPNRMLEEDALRVVAVLLQECCLLQDMKDELV